jgi:hypothetical protein
MLTIVQISSLISYFPLESEQQACLTTEPQVECRRQYSVQTRIHDSPFDPHLTLQDSRYKYISHSWKQSGPSRIPNPIFREEIHLTNTEKSHLFHYFVIAFHLSMWRLLSPRTLADNVYVRLQQISRPNKIAYYLLFLIPYVHKLLTKLSSLLFICNIPSHNSSTQCNVYIHDQFI